MPIRGAMLIPLESGDRLTREQFHHRYLARPDIKKAELVEGVVYVASPVSMTHGEPHASVAGWLYAHKARTPNLRLCDNATVFLTAESEVQPDVCMFRDSPASRARLIQTDAGTTYIEGAPDLVVEIAASSASYDLHDKLRAYERAGVPEYIVWQVYERRIDWFVLGDGAYIALTPDREGVIESRVFPGLRLAVERMLVGDDAAVLAALDVGRTFGC